MSLLYGRQALIRVAGLTIEEPRIAFDLRRTPDETADPAQIRIWNLSPEHEARIYEGDQPILLQAGYPATLATLFDGAVQQIWREREDLSRITVLECTGMLQSRRLLGGITSRSYAGDVPVRRLIRDIIADLGLAPGPLDLINPAAQYRNFAWSRTSTSALSYLAHAIGLRWFESDGLIRFRREGVPQPDAPTIDCNPDRGMISSPTPTEDGLEVRMLLTGEVQIGSKVHLRSEIYHGTFICTNIRHIGDTWDGPFETKLEIRPEMAEAPSG